MPLDRILDLKVGPAEGWRTEMDFYRRQLNTYGLAPR